MILRQWSIRKSLLGTGSSLSFVVCQMSVSQMVLDQKFKTSLCRFKKTQWPFFLLSLLFFSSSRWHRQLLDSNPWPQDDKSSVYHCTTATGQADQVLFLHYNNSYKNFTSSNLTYNEWRYSNETRLELLDSMYFNNW
jgi:hypothetical protein